MLIVERALRDKAPIIVDIRRPGVILFRSALAGYDRGERGLAGTKGPNRVPVRDKHGAVGGALGGSGRRPVEAGAHGKSAAGRKPERIPLCAQPRGRRRPVDTPGVS